MNKLLFIFLLNSITIFSGCSGEIDIKTVIGNYVANHQKGTDTLELRPDGTYNYQYIFPDGGEIKISNKWEFNNSDGKPIITFHKFIFGLPGYGSKDPGFWIVEVKRTLTGDLRLVIDPDLNYYYIKQK